MDSPRILLIYIKFLGICLCPWCLVEKANVPDTGTVTDMTTHKTKILVPNNTYRRKIANARKLIFKFRASINGRCVQSLLQDESLVPIMVSERLKYCIWTDFNLECLSEHLSDEEFYFFLMLVVDLLHEFELGMWKAIFTHLMHILYATGGSVVQQLNSR